MKIINSHMHNNFPSGNENYLNIGWSILVFEDYSLKCEESFCNCS